MRRRSYRPRLYARAHLGCLGCSAPVWAALGALAAVLAAKDGKPSGDPQPQEPTDTSTQLLDKTGWPHLKWPEENEDWLGKNPPLFPDDEQPEHPVKKERP